MADNLFISMTKICAQQQKQSQILSIELLKLLSEYTKSGFFATQTLCQIIERDQALYPQAMRALGCLSQATSRPEIEKLVNRAFLDCSRKRNIAAAVLAAYHQNIQIPLQNSERVLGPPGYIAVQHYDEGTIQALSAKYNALANPYTCVAIIEKLAHIQGLEDRKKLQKFLSFLPQNKKDLSVANLAPYLEAFKAITNLDFDVVKPYLSQVFNSFSIIFSLVKSSYVQVAFLRQILKVHQTAVSENVPVSDLKALNEVLESNQHNHNQTIATLCSINLIMSTYDMNAIMKLVDMLPDLTQDLKHNALKLLGGLATHERLYSNIIPMYKRFLQQHDVDIKSCGIKALSDILQRTQDQKLRSTLASVVLSNLDAVGADSDLRSLLCSQLAHLDVDNYDEAVELAAALWQRCMIDGVEMRIASVQALYGLTKRFKVLNPIIEKVLSLQNDVFVRNALVERDEDILSKYADRLQEFNPDQIISNTKNIVRNNYAAVTFTKTVQKQPQKANQEAKASQTLELIKKNPNYQQFEHKFTNALPTVLSSVQCDFVLEVYKVYYFAQDNQSGEVLYYFKTSADEGVEFVAQKLKIGRKGHTFNNGELVHIETFDSVDEASLKQLRFFYTLEGQDASVYVDDINTEIVDLTSTQFDGDIEKYFQSQEENKAKIKTTLQTFEELIETYQTKLGLSLNNLKMEGRKCEFTLAGHIYGSGNVVCKCHCTLVEGKGIKLKVDCRGPAGYIILESLSC